MTSIERVKAAIRHGSGYSVRTFVFAHAAMFALLMTGFFLLKALAATYRISVVAQGSSPTGDANELVLFWASIALLVGLAIALVLIPLGFNRAMSRARRRRDRRPPDKPIEEEQRELPLMTAAGGR